MFDSKWGKSWLVIAFVGAAQIGSSVFMNTVVFQGRILEILLDVYDATSGLIHPTLVANLVPLLLVVGLAMFAIGRLKPEGVGWLWSKLWPAVLVTLGMWSVAQMILAAIAASGEGGIALHHAYMQPGASFVFGGVLGQVCGNALVEETVFRGFLFPQFYYKFAKRPGRVRALVAAAIVSQVCFALVHLPNRIFVKDVSGADILADQVQLVVMGLFFLALYLVTHNLLIVVGLHALVNDPAPLIQTPNGVVDAVWLSMMLLLLLLWAPVRRWVRR